jgi:hypothetical protein
MIRATLLAFFLLPLGCTVRSLPGSESNRLGAGDGGTSVDLGPGGHLDGSCGGSVDLAGGWWSDGGVGVDAWFFDLGYGADAAAPHDAGPHDAGPHVDLAH